MDDAVGGYTALDLEAFCARFYNGKRLLITPYAYPVVFLALAQNAQATQQLNIAANADFVLLGLRHRGVLAAAGQTVSTKPAPIVRILVTDSGSSEQYTNGAVDLETISSNDAKINNLAYPRLVSGRSSLTVQVTNYAPAAETWTSLEISFWGALVRAYTG